MRRLKISYGRTVQPMKFESIRMDVAVEKDVPDGDALLEEANKSVESLRKYVEVKLNETVKMLYN